MLKNITILIEDYKYLDRDYAISFRDHTFLPKLLRALDKEIIEREFYDEEMIIDLLTMKIICYKIKKPLSLFIALTFDDSIVPENIFPSIYRLVEIAIKFVKKTGVTGELSTQNQKTLDIECDAIIKELLELRPPKICVIGYDFVGKTSVCGLIKNGKVPEKYIETTFMEKSSSDLYGIPLLLWDIPDPGDLNSKRMWSKFLLGSNAVILVLDSTEKNAEESKLMIEMTDEIIPHAELLILANKQDKEGALSPEDLESILLFKVFPFVAKNENAGLIQRQTAKLLEIKSEKIDYSRKENFIIQRND
ncbi:MAG: ADP-ribosylation factor-like protein [Promethearchaeota archaeon]